VSERGNVPNFFRRATFTADPKHGWFPGGRFFCPSLASQPAANAHTETAHEPSPLQLMTLTWRSAPFSLRKHATKPSWARSDEEDSVPHCLSVECV
jgi:hypothetical protein